MIVRHEGDRRRSRVVLKPGRHFVGSWGNKTWFYLDDPTEVTRVECFKDYAGVGWHFECYEIEDAVPRPDKLGRWRRAWRFLFRRRAKLPEARMLP